MSSKINIYGIIKEHLGTLCDADNIPSNIDRFVFFGIPLTLSILFVFLDFKIEQKTISLLVNFGSIFTALLLSVLVLVYDQRTKLKSQNGNDKRINWKKELTRQLFINISYSILVSILLVILCFTYTILGGVEVKNSSKLVIFNTYLTVPLIIFCTLNLLLSILMVVRRMHTMLSK